MANTLRAIDYLRAPEKYPPAPVCVVFGDESFLKREVLVRLRHTVLGNEGDLSFSSFEGPECRWADVLGELSTLAMFGGKRLALVEEADNFVSLYRGDLEAYVKKPKSGGVLVLEVSSWAGNTKLYKEVDKSGIQIACFAPETKRKADALSWKRGEVTSWLVAWAKQTHGLQIASSAVDLLVDMIGPQLGLLDQELAKLAVSAGPGGKVGREQVEQMAAWRARTTWDMLDAALEGDLRKTLTQLDRLLLAGENAIGILAQLAASLRRLAAATRLMLAAEAEGRRVALRSVLQELGVNPFFLDKTERQLRRLGRHRGEQIYRWLLEADLDLKGDSRLSPQMVLERLLVRIAAPPAPAKP